MMRRFVLLALAPILLASAARAETAPPFEQHYAPAEDLEALDVAEIDQAGETLDIAAYVLTDVPVIEALTNAAARGVKVRLYRWREEHAASGPIAAALAAMRAAGVAERFKTPDAPPMHLKTYCVDHRLLRFGAANFSRSGLKDQDNDLDIARGPGVCARFEADFESMWGRP